MNVRRVNLILRASAAACVAAAVGLLAWHLLSQVHEASVAATGDESVGSGPATAAAEQRLPPLESFSAAWARPLRQPLAAVAPAATTAATSRPAHATSRRPKEPPPFPYTLVGTIGQSVAFMRGVDGSVEACGVGDAIGGATVIAVRSAEVDLRVGDQTVTLRKLPDVEEDNLIVPADPQGTASAVSSLNPLTAPVRQGR